MSRCLLRQEQLFLLLAMQFNKWSGAKKPKVVGFQTDIINIERRLRSSCSPLLYISFIMKHFQCPLESIARCSESVFFAVAIHMKTHWPHANQIGSQTFHLAHLCSMCTKSLDHWFCSYGYQPSHVSQAVSSVPALECRFRGSRHAWKNEHEEPAFVSQTTLGNS